MVTEDRFTPSLSAAYRTARLSRSGSGDAVDVPLDRSKVRDRDPNPRAGDPHEGGVLRRGEHLTDDLRPGALPRQVGEHRPVGGGDVGAESRQAGDEGYRVIAAAQDAIAQREEERLVAVAARVVRVGVAAAGEQDRRSAVELVRSLAP